MCGVALKGQCEVGSTCSLLQIVQSYLKGNHEDRLQVAFLMGSFSSSAQQYVADMIAQVELAKNMIITDFNVLPGQTQIGVVLYGDQAEVPITFDDYHDKSALLEAMSRIRYPEVGSNIESGVKRAEKMLLQAKQEGVPQMLFVFINDINSNDQQGVFDSLKESDIDLMVVNMQKVIKGNSSLIGPTR